MAASQILVVMTDSIKIETKLHIERNYTTRRLLIKSNITIIVKLTGCLYRNIIHFLVLKKIVFIAKNYNYLQYVR